jgi:hypothetical protein
MVQLVATVTNAANASTSVTWEVNGVPNGNSSTGTIAATGADTAVYTAPATAPNSSSVTIIADSTADPSKSGDLVETVQGCKLNGTIGYVAPAPYVPSSAASCDVSDVSTLEACVTAARPPGSCERIRIPIPF